MSVKQLVAGKHSCVGNLSSIAPTEGESDAFNDRPAMLVYCGKFDSMDGKVQVDESHIDALIENHNAKLGKFSNLAAGDESYHGAMPPLQVDHSTSAMMTVGRVIGRLSKGVHTLEDGSQVPALVCDKVRVLGKENVEKVKDKRWSSVSIGADLENGTLNELSITPFPAAPNASLLSKFSSTESLEMVRQICNVVCGVNYKLYQVGSSFTIDCLDEIMAKKLQNTIDTNKNFKHARRYLNEVYFDRNPSTQLSEGEKTMSEKLKKHLIDSYKMSDDEALAHYGKMKAHMGKQLAAEEAKVDEHMSKMSDDEMSKLADDIKEEEKKLAHKDEPGTDEAEELKKLRAKKSEIVKLAKGFIKNSGATKLAARNLQAQAKLSKLRACQKITPAEQKKEIARLSKLSDAELAGAMTSYENREPVIDASIRGTTRAVNLAKLQKDSRLARLEAETKKDLGLDLDDKDKKVLAEVPAVHTEAPVHPDHEEHMKHLEHLLGQYDQRDAVMAHVKKMMEQPQEMSAEVSEEGEKQMSALAENVNRLQNQFQDLIKMIGDATGIESAELTE